MGMGGGVGGEEELFRGEEVVVEIEEAEEEGG